MEHQQNVAPSTASCSQTPLLKRAEVVLERLASQEVELIKDIEDLFKRAQKDHFERIDKLQHSIPNMDRVGEDIRRVSGLVDNAFTEVEDVCKEFRRIDLAKARVEDCIAKLDDILDLRMCRDGATQAMKQSNFEEAAIHIKRYLSIDQDRLRKTISAIHGQQSNDDEFFTTQPKKVSHNLFDLSDDLGEDSFKVSSLGTDATIDPHSMELALRELDEVRSRLLLLCKENFIQSIKSNDTKEIERFFKLFPMLNEHQVGLTKYAEYLQCKIVDKQIDESFKSKQVNQASKLGSLYESVARLIDSHQAVVETHYGPGKLITVVRILQNECDRLSRTILEEFRDETKLQSIVKIAKTSFQMKSSAANSNFQQNQATKLDLGNIDNIINEISIIIFKSEVYINFIIQRLKDDLESNCENEDQKQAGLLEIYNLTCVDCELNLLIQEVCSIYVMLEQYYLNESSKIAITKDQIEETSKCLFSSMLDDIFFRIKKCTKRAISTKSNEAFCAIINHCVTLLESTFSQVLQERIRSNQNNSYKFFALKNLDLSSAYSAIQSARYLQSGNEFDKARAQYLSALNNLNKACDYIQTLRGMLDSHIKNLKPSLLLVDKQKDNHLAKSALCLDELSQLVSRFKSIVDSSLYQFFNSGMRDRMKSELKIIMTENPELTYSPEEAVSLAKYLLDTLDNTLLESLTTENGQKLTTIVEEFLESTMKTVK